MSNETPDGDTLIVKFNADQPLCLSLWVSLWYLIVTSTTGNGSTVVCFGGLIAPILLSPRIPRAEGPVGANLAKTTDLQCRENCHLQAATHSDSDSLEPDTHRRRGRRRRIVVDVISHHRGLPPRGVSHTFAKYKSKRKNKSLRKVSLSPTPWHTGSHSTNHPPRSY